MSSKTLIQKKGFFVDLFLNLGLNYRPHFYGPYSPDLDAAIGQCKALGFVEERVAEYGLSSNSGFEVKRFDYELTQDGRIVVEAIRARDSLFYSKVEECLKRLEQAGELDYVQLSIAAKAIYIQKTHNKPMYQKEIAKEAKNFNWEITEPAVDKVIGFLKKLNLVTTNSPA